MHASSLLSPPSRHYISITRWLTTKTINGPNFTDIFHMQWASFRNSIRQPRPLLLVKEMKSRILWSGWRIYFPSSPLASIFHGSKHTRLWQISDFDRLDSTGPRKRRAEQKIGQAKRLVNRCFNVMKFEKSLSTVLQPLRKNRWLMLLFVSLPNRSRLRVSGIQKVYSCAQGPIEQINTLDPCQSSPRPQGTTLRAGSFFKHHAFPFVFPSHRTCRIRSIFGRIPQTRWRTFKVSWYFQVLEHQRHNKCLCGHKWPHSSIVAATKQSTSKGG